MHCERGKVWCLFSSISVYGSCVCKWLSGRQCDVCTVSENVEETTRVWTLHDWSCNRIYQSRLLGSAGHCLSFLICRALSLTFDVVTECVVIMYMIDVFCCWQLSGEWELLPERCAWGSYSCLCGWYLFKGTQIFKVEYEVNSLCYMVCIHWENSLCMQSSFVLN